MLEIVYNNIRAKTGGKHLTGAMKSSFCPVNIYLATPSSILGSQGTINTNAPESLIVFDDQ